MRPIDAFDTIIKRSRRSARQLCDRDKIQNIRKIFQHDYV